MPCPERVDCAIQRQLPVPPSGVGRQNDRGHLPEGGWDGGGPVRVAACTVTVPIEVARTTFNILRLTEELLEEVVFLLRSMRPVVEAVSTAQQTDNFDTVFRTLEQIQHTARAPIGAVRSALAPVRPFRAGHPPVIEAEPLQTPGVIRIASITVTMPGITVGKPSRSLSLPG